MEPVHWKHGSSIAVEMTFIEYGSIYVLSLLSPSLPPSLLSLTHSPLHGSLLTLLIIASIVISKIGQVACRVERKRERERERERKRKRVSE